MISAFFAVFYTALSQIGKNGLAVYEDYIKPI
jgi:hypothetical protein